MTDNEKLYVTKTFMPPIEEYEAEIRSLWESSWITNMGTKHEELTEKLRLFLGVDSLSLMSSGHMALELCLSAMDLEGEVVTTPFTFASTTHAITRNNLTPVFADIRPDDFTLDASKIEDLITDRTCAILPVHVYGNVCDVEAIREIADRHHLKVIYDAAHAFGVEAYDRGIGSFGDASIFSFHATKVFHTVEGGAVCFSDPALGQKLYELKNFGIMDETTVTGIGANAKMSEFHAAMGIVNLRYHAENMRRREAVWKIYTEELSGIRGLQIPADDNERYPLSDRTMKSGTAIDHASGDVESGPAIGLASGDIKGGQSPDTTRRYFPARMGRNIKKNYAYFPIVIDREVFGMDRDEVFDRLAKQNIFARKYFYPLTSDYDCYRGILRHGSTPVADRVASSVITLPLFPSMRAEDAVRVSAVIKSCLR